LSIYLLVFAHASPRNSKAAHKKLMRSLSHSPTVQPLSTISPFTSPISLFTPPLSPVNLAVPSNSNSHIAQFTPSPLIQHVSPSPISPQLTLLSPIASIPKKKHYLSNKIPSIYNISQLSLSAPSSSPIKHALHSEDLCRTLLDFIDHRSCLSFAVACKYTKEVTHVYNNRLANNTLSNYINARNTVSTVLLLHRYTISVDHHSLFLEALNRHMFGLVRFLLYTRTAHVQSALPAALHKCIKLRHEVLAAELVKRWQPIPSSMRNETGILLKEMIDIGMNGAFLQLLLLQLDSGSLPAFISRVLLPRAVSKRNSFLIKELSRWPNINIDLAYLRARERGHHELADYLQFSSGKQVSTRAINKAARNRRAPTIIKNRID
jgi:hypothetical protein